MYQPLLISKYLRRKLAPLFAALAVTLCTMMVIIVMSVMGGFLDMMRSAAQRLTGDVTIMADFRGFAHYEELMADLRQLPEVAAVTAVIRTGGMATFEDPGFGDRVHLVEVVGIDGPSFDAVLGYAETLYWTAEDVKQRFDLDEGPDLRAHGLALTTPGVWRLPEGTAAAVAGIEVNPYNRRDERGRYALPGSAVGQLVSISVPPVTAGGSFTEPRTAKFAVVNEFKSGLYDIDSQRIYVPFAVLQKVMRMDAAEAVDLDTGEPTGRTIPARASEVMVRGAAGVPLAELDRRVRGVARHFHERHSGVVPYLGTQTWEQRHAVLLGAVANEKGLITFLFAIIGLVSVVMVATTFYMIVLEKTRDIGVLRAIGASRVGVAGIFLGYGLAVGVVGALLGLVAGVAIVTHLNEIQEVLYQVTLWWNQSVLGNDLGGWRMWNPQTYYFDRIPDHVNPAEAAWVVAFAMTSSVLGAVIPAALAARLDPVVSLRYE